MTRKPLDILLAKDGSTRLLPWIIAFMVYIATLTVAGGMILSDAARTWSEGLAGSLTVQIPVDLDAAGDDINRRITQAIAAVEGMAGIEEIRVMPQAEIQRLLEPWLGPSVDPGGLPLPRLITILLDGDGPDPEELRRRLIAVVPDAVVDDHKIWRERLVALMNALQLVALAIVLIVAGTGLFVVVFATRGGLATHRGVIEVLHLIGARDDYIAGQFQRHASLTAFRGALFGVFFGAGTIIGLGHVANSLGGDMVTPAVLGVWQWLGMGLIPVVAGLIALVSARRTVRHALRKMM